MQFNILGEVKGELFYNSSEFANTCDSNISISENINYLK